MAQIVTTKAKADRCNLAAISSGGSKANTVLAANEVWLVDTTNASKGTNGYGKYDSYIVGDGVTVASSLTVLPIDTGSSASALTNAEIDTIWNNVMLITFTMTSNDLTPVTTQYQAGEGMTWGEWVNSEYNTGGWSINADQQIVDNNLHILHNYYPTDIIQSQEYIYDHLMAGGGSN